MIHSQAKGKLLATFLVVVVVLFFSPLWLQRAEAKSLSQFKVLMAGDLEQAYSISQGKRSGYHSTVAFHYDELRENFQEFIQMVMEMMGEIPSQGASEEYDIDTIEFNAAIDVGGNWVIVNAGVNGGIRIILKKR